MEHQPPPVNPARGEVAFDLRGRWLVLRMSYGAVAQLVAEHGQEFDKKLDESLRLWQPEAIARTIYILALDRQPELTWEEVRAAEPPMLPARDAISLAFQGFLFGSSTPDPADRKKREEANGHDDPLVGLMRLSALFRRRSRSASTTTSSGGSPPAS